MRKFLIGILVSSCLTPSIAFSMMKDRDDELVTGSAVTSSSYKLARTIEEIKQLRREGKKLGLFIGRTSGEPLPNANDEQLFPEDKGIIWVSGDYFEGMPIDDRRLHVLVDFNKDDEVALLNGLFDKVVVDISTWKFFDTTELSDPAERFSKLLVKNPTSTFIFESAFQYITLDENITEPVYDTYTYTLPSKTPYSVQKDSIFFEIKSDVERIFKDEELKEEQNKILAKGLAAIRNEMQNDNYETDDLNDIKNTYIWKIKMPKALREAGLPEEDPIETTIDHESIVRQNTCKHLEKFFKEVELVIKGPFYRNNHNEIPTYFIARDPK